MSPAPGKGAPPPTPSFPSLLGAACEMRTGFLALRACGADAIARCGRCSKPVCLRHAMRADGTPVASRPLATLAGAICSECASASDDDDDSSSDSDSGGDDTDSGAAGGNAGSGNAGGRDSGSLPANSGAAAAFDVQDRQGFVRRRPVDDAGELQDGVLPDDEEGADAFDAS